MFGSSLYFVYLYVAMACASPNTARTASSSSANGNYTEDLSGLRPRVENASADSSKPAGNTSGTGTSKAYVEPKFAVNEKLDGVLDSIDRINLARKFVDGFTIQVYSGRREEALNTKKQLTSLLPEITSEVQFTEPIFRVKAGKYYNWVDAQSDFALIKKYFPAAIVIPDRIPMN